MKTTSDVEVRDQREKDWYWTNNLFIDIYGQLVGTHAVAVYSVLCRYSNNETQKCFPSMDTIGRNAGIKSRKTVSQAIKMLEAFQIIEIESAKGADGKRLNNIYHLRKPSAWKKIHVSVGFVKSEATAEELEGEDVYEVSVVPVKKKEVVTELPSWLDLGAWARWLQYKKERKEKMPNTTIAFQIRRLEKLGIKDHVAVIDQAMEKGWRGFYPLERNFNNVKKVEAPTGKYSHISK